MTHNPLLALSRHTDQLVSTETAEQESIPQTNPLIGVGGILDQLDDRQQHFLIAKLYGVSDAEAARTVGVPASTVQNWKAQNVRCFAEAYEQVTKFPIEMAASASQFAFAKAMHKLALMLDHQNIQVVQWAIEKLINIGGLNKIKVEHEHKGRRVDDDDVDALIAAYEQRKRDDNAGESAGDNSL